MIFPNYPMHQVQILLYILPTAVFLDSTVSDGRTPTLFLLQDLGIPHTPL